MDTILITGTSRGIGKELAKQFLGSGYKVVGVARGESSIQNKCYQHFSCDLESDDELAEFCQKIKNLSINVFCHSAMYTPKHRPFLRVKIEDMQRSYRVSTISALEIIKAIYSQLKENNGSIILLSSMITLMGSKGQLPYLCAKSSLTGLVKGLAMEFGKTRITINGLALGLVDTAKLRENIEEEKIQELLKKIPNHKFIEIREIKDKIEMLMGDKDISGQIITLGDLPE